MLNCQTFFCKTSFTVSMVVRMREETQYWRKTCYWQRSDTPRRVGDRLRRTAD